MNTCIVHGNETIPLLDGHRLVTQAQADLLHLDVEAVQIHVDDDTRTTAHKSEWVSE